MEIKIAYCDIDKKEYTLDELNNLYNERMSIGRLYGHLFCPMCKKAELSYTQKNRHSRAYLSAIDINEHAEECMCLNNYTPKEVVVKYIENFSDAQIKDKINSLLRQLDDKRIIKNIINENISEFDGRSKFIDNYSTNNVTRRVIIRQIKLTSNMEIDNNDEVYFVYGKVKIKLITIQKNDKHPDLYIMQLISLDDNKIICSVKCGRNKYDVKDESTYKIAICGIIEKKNQYIDIKPIKDAIKIVKI